MPTNYAPQYERGRLITVDEMKVKNKTVTPKKIEVPFIFNPSEISISKSNSFNPSKADKKADKKTLESEGGQPLDISFQLFFDTYEEHLSAQLDGGSRDVRVYTDRLFDMTQVQKELQGSPPQVRLEWGKLQQWRLPFYVTSVGLKFLMFLPNGTPVRATADIKGKSDYNQHLGPQNPTSGGEGDERVRLVQPGDRLDLIAYQEYGDSGLWRIIADANRLSGPRDLFQGQRLAIPPRR